MSPRWPGPISATERFWSHVEKAGECWLWTARRNPKGYGKGTYQSREIMAHRLSWVLNVGPIPAGMSVLHSCDNPPCVNPAHLWLGTHQDNMNDMVAKGRQGKRRHAA